MPRKRTLEDRFWTKVNKTETCWLWTGGTVSKTSRYGRINCDGRLRLTHHVAWNLAGGTIADGLQVLHTCDTPACVRNDDIGTYEVRGVTHERRGHLFVGTIAVNAADRAQKGRVPILHPNGPGAFRGEDNPRARLTVDDVREIRRLAALPGANLARLGRAYGVSANQIGYIVHYKSWRHIDPRGYSEKAPTVTDVTAL